MGANNAILPITPLTLAGVTTDLYDACKMLKRAWDLGEESNEVEWEELVMAVGLAETALEKVDELSVQRYCVVINNRRNTETNEPLFWSSSRQWVSLHEADVYGVSEDADCAELLAARFPREAWGLVELPSSGRLQNLA